jgi:hypothetical protein
MREHLGRCCLIEFRIVKNHPIRSLLTSVVVSLTSRADDSTYRGQADEELKVLGKHVMKILGRLNFRTDCSFEVIYCHVLEEHILSSC